MTAATVTPQATDSSCFGRPPAGTPSRLPHGYRFLWELSSPFGAHGKQATEVYNRTCADPDADYPVLIIHVIDADQPLSAGGRRPGQPVQLTSAQSTGLYYQRFLPPDLRPLLCQGSDYWIPNARMACRWETATMNLLLVEGRQESYAILGSRRNGIGMHELVTIAHRLSGANAT